MLHHLCPNLTFNHVLTIFCQEKTMKRFLRILISVGIFVYSSAYAEKNILNIYAWSSEIPQEIIDQFEKETGIKVNYSVFDSNEIMYTKLRTNPTGYDITEPSTYYIERMS